MMSDSSSSEMAGASRTGFAHNNNDDQQGSRGGGLAPSRGRGGGFPIHEENFSSNANRVPLGDGYATRGRGGFTSRGGFNQDGNEFASTGGRGGFTSRGGFNQDGNEFASTGGRGGFTSRGGFNQNQNEFASTRGRGFSNHSDGNNHSGRGFAPTRGRGSFQNRENGFPSNANRVPLGDGFAPTRGRGGYSNQIGGNNQAGGYARGCGFANRGGYNQDRAEGDRGLDGYLYSKTRGTFARRNDNEEIEDADDKEPVQDDADPPRARPNSRSFARNAEELFTEDEQAASNYADIGDQDEDCIVYNLDEEYVRMQTWEEAFFEPQVFKNVKERSCYIRPRKIQSVAIPFIADRFDVVAQSETGSGKTAAYLIPIIDNCLKDKAEGNFKSNLVLPYAIIIGPTREFVLQIFEQARKFADGTGVTVARAYGELEINQNWREIKKGCDILVATPGRLKDYVINAHIFVKGLNVLVLDEADRLLDYKFSDDILEIVRTEGFPSTDKRQTLLFTATFTDDIKQIAKFVLKHKALLITNNKPAANKRIKQDFVVANNQSKLDKLLEILKAEVEKAGVEKMRRTLVFVNTKRMSDLVALYLSQNGVPANSINSDRPQHLREQALTEFRNQEVPCLVATDVCCRGIDIKGLDHVINMELPDNAKNYVYRIGRTGRITQGYATTFVSCKEPVLNEIADMLRVNGEVPETLNTILEEVDSFWLGDPQMCSTPIDSAPHSDDDELF